MDLKPNLNEIFNYITKYLSSHDVKNPEHISEFESKLISMIILDEKIALCQSSNGTTLGMIACQFKLNNVAKKCLDVEGTATQTDIYGFNIGMNAARFGLEDVALKALNSKEASIQINDDAKNIGMLCATYDLHDATLKALDNKIASCQQDWDGYNIGMIAATKGWKDCVLKALENPVASKQKCLTIFDKDKTILDFAKQNGIDCSPSKTDIELENNLDKLHDDIFNL